MKKVENISKVSLTFEELMNCRSINTNRCGYLTKEDAINNGFSETDWNKFNSRAKKLKKIIKKNGFSKASFFVLAKDTDDNLYLLDGQGRRKALDLIQAEDGVDISSWEFACDLYNDPMPIEEMSRLIIDLNTGNTNWQTKDLRRSYAISSDDPGVVEAYNYTKKLMDEHELGDYVACLFTFGEKASQQRKAACDPFSTKDYASTKDAFTEAYLKLVDTLSYKLDRDGSVKERCDTTKKKIRNVNFAISLNSCFRSIVKVHKNDIDGSREDLLYLVDQIISAANGDDAYVDQFFSCAKKDKDVVATKVKRYIKNKRVYEALYKNDLFFQMAA